MQRDRVLLATADDALAARLSEELQRGYDTTLATSGEAARQCVSNDTFELIVIDIPLPDVDGIEFTRQLAARHDLLLLTAPGDTRQRVRGLYAGAQDCLAKPFAMPELLARIYSRLRTTHARRLAAGDADRGATGVLFAG